ncbi:MAG: MFS transporter, partial [Enterobacterales bacterium]|nr:MFS transporter [Enterobacterales bacterium]
MGFYSTGQFFGAFLGGLLAGYLLQHTGSLAVFWLLSGLAFVWLVVVWLWFKPLRDSELPNE